MAKMPVQSAHMPTNMSDTQPETFHLTGTVIHGVKLGRKLGFPTANLDRRSYGKSNIVIPFGIYGGYAQIEKQKKIYQAAIVIGPYDKKGLPKLEVHILDFKGNLYGKRLTASLKFFVRKFRGYTNQESLIRDIAADITEIRNKLTTQ